MEILESKRQPELETLERKQLRELEQSGLYVFHGTPADVEELEPRQAIDHEIGPDDEPGVHASQFADYAIFMAVAAQLGRTKSGVTETITDTQHTVALEFGMSQNAADHLTDDTNGLVYVLDKSGFIQRRKAEWICPKAVKPVMKIRVFKRDLPKNIDIF